MNSPSSPRAAYIHTPFCRHRCGYCNFTVTAGRDDLIEAFLQALERELSALGAPRSVDTLFIGGGTPTHLSVEQLTRLLRITAAWHPPAPACEWSVEANPVDLTADKIDLLADLGVTRLSIGVQSFDAAKLRVLERDHDAEQVEQAVARARNRFLSVSLDLIFAAPGESLSGWHRDLERAVELRPNHISTYGLTYERGAAFWSRARKGELRPVGEEGERAMYEDAIDLLTAAGFEHYEVSNFARAGHRCRHNEVYWTGGEYYAAGPGASRYVAGQRQTNHQSTTTYLHRVLAGKSPVAFSESLDCEARARERLVFGMRMLAGVDCRQFAAATGYEVEQLCGDALRRLIDLKLLEEQQGRMRLTRAGLMVSDSIWPEIL